MLTEKDFRDTLEDSDRERNQSGGSKVLVLILYAAAIVSSIACSYTGYNADNYEETGSWVTIGILFALVFVGIALVTPYLLDNNEPVRLSDE